MLVITRKQGEALVIGENIHIKVESINNKQVKLSIDAPKDILILREEIVQEITKENQAATLQTPNAQLLNQLANQLKKKNKNID